MDGSSMNTTRFIKNVAGLAFTAGTIGIVYLLLVGSGAF